jgi:hypothetical protein
MTDRAPNRSWAVACLVGVGILVGFFVLTVVLPNFVLTLDAIETGSAIVRDAVTVVLWLVGLGATMAGLRVAQRRGLI